MTQPNTTPAAVKVCQPPRLYPDAPEITCNQPVPAGEEQCWRHQPCKAPSEYTDGEPCEAFAEPAGDLCDEHRVRRLAAMDVALTRAAVRQALLDAAKALRAAEQAAGKLAGIDAVDTPADELARAIHLALTGVHAAKHLAPEPEQLPAWMGDPPRI